MLRGYLALSDRTSRAAETLAVLLLYGFCALMLAEVFARGFIGTSLAMSWEFSAFAMAGVFLLGAGPAMRHGAHVRVTLVQGLLPPKGRRVLEVVAILGAIACAALLFWIFTRLFLNSWAKDLRQSSYTATPLIWPHALAMLGAAQFVLDLVARLIRTLLNEPSEQPLPKVPELTDA
ncbi:TRAP transporter small permease [Falsigemmobacter faecalis]|uniref:TRAP transporter small permease protein n=1 Tax=Falsigemmobacter faecalis TaxID=2488730 RepID=A0A3P3DFC6_9RHOB|nr:TRAP transporter small permease [Falsigemmobacter faecalis]RRH72979.1 TRAP transporter small permease [Falsigemmobacter faecalis]